MNQSKPGRGARSIYLILITAAVFLVSSCSQGTAIEAPLAPDDAIFRDNFDSPTLGNWFIESDEFSGSAVENDRLIIRSSMANMIHYSTLREPSFEDFRLQVDIASLDGSAAVSYGVLFRMNERNEYYRFDITGDGRFMVEKANSDGSWTRFLNDWKRDNSIQIGQDSQNTLRVDAIGPSLSFYVNNHLVHSLTDSELTSGNIGLDLGTFDQPSASAAFDNLIILAP